MGFILVINHLPVVTQVKFFKGLPLPSSSCNMATIRKLSVMKAKQFLSKTLCLGQHCLISNCEGLGTSAGRALQTP